MRKYNPTNKNYRNRWRDGLINDYSSPQQYMRGWYDFSLNLDYYSPLWIVIPNTLNTLSNVVSRDSTGIRCTWGGSTYTSFWIQALPNNKIYNDFEIILPYNFITVPATRSVWVSLILYISSTYYIQLMYGFGSGSNIVLYIGYRVNPSSVELGRTTATADRTGFLRITRTSNTFYLSKGTTFGTWTSLWSYNWGSAPGVYPMVGSYTDTNYPVSVMSFGDLILLKGDVGYGL